MHPTEYDRYISIKTPNSHTDVDAQQSVVSTIKNEDLEFVEVNQDEMPEETWDSFESSDFYENFDAHQVSTQSAATSTTKTTRPALANDDRSFESGRFMDTADAASSNDESNEWDDSKNMRLPLLFRGGFFRYLKTDGVLVRAKCLKCKHGNIHSGHVWSGSTFIKHLSRMHPRDYDRFLVMKEEEKLSFLQPAPDYQAQQFEQNDINRIVSNFMISGMHHPRLLEDPSFAVFLNDISAKRIPGEPSQHLYHIVSPELLNAEIDERFSANKKRLQSSFKEVSSVSISVDVWMVQEKTFMTVIANWIDGSNFKRISDVIGCEIFADFISSESIVERLLQICSKYDLTNKIIATVTNNNPPFEKGGQFGDVAYLELRCLHNHIKNPTYLFELIGIEDARKALSDQQYAELHRSAFDKFDTLFEKTKSGNLSEKSKSILIGVFKYASIGSKVTEIYNSISNLVKCNNEHLTEITNELAIPSFTEDDIKFLKEYAIILEPIATVIEYLQKNNCYYATLLPLVYSMKDNLIDVRNQDKIQLCQSLLTAILNGVDHTFHHLFDFNNEKCIPALIATCTHPFFKMRWLKGDLKTPNNTNQILNLLVKVAKEFDDGIKKECTSSNNDEIPQQKKFKFSFDTTVNINANDETIIHMDFKSFLKKPCLNDESNLEELKQHPFVQKLFIRYNSIISSAAALERSFPLSDLIRKSRFGQFSDDLFRKLGLIRAAPPKSN